MTQTRRLNAHLTYKWEVKPIISLKDVVFLAALAATIVGIVVGVLVLAALGAVVAIAILLFTGTRMFHRQNQARKRAEVARAARYAEFYDKK